AELSSCTGLRGPWGPISPFTPFSPKEWTAGASDARASKPWPAITSTRCAKSSPVARTSLEATVSAELWLLRWPSNCGSKVSRPTWWQCSARLCDSIAHPANVRLLPSAPPSLPALLEGGPSWAESKEQYAGEQKTCCMPAGGWCTNTAAGGWSLLEFRSHRNGANSISRALCCKRRRDIRRSSWTEDW